MRTTRAALHVARFMGRTGRPGRSGRIRSGPLLRAGGSTACTKAPQHPRCSSQGGLSSHRPNPACRARSRSAWRPRRWQTIARNTVLRLGTWRPVSRSDSSSAQRGLESSGTEADRREIVIGPIFFPFVGSFWVIRTTRSNRQRRPRPPPARSPGTTGISSRGSGRIARATADIRGGTPPGRRCTGQNKPRGRVDASYGPGVQGRARRTSEAASDSWRPRM